MSKKEKVNTGNTEKTQLSANGIKGAIPVLASVDINTEDGQSDACREIFRSLSQGTAEPETTRLMLSTIGKVLTRESLKVKAGIYKMAGAKNKFFLSA